MPWCGRGDRRGVAAPAAGSSLSLSPAATEHVMNARVCRHCEQRPAVTAWGLCECCDRTRGVRLLYLPNQPHGRRRGDPRPSAAVRQRGSAALSAALLSPTNQRSFFAQEPSCTSCLRLPSGRDDVDQARSLNTCAVICPLCKGPMTPRLSKAGPYFHCLCHEPAAAPTHRCCPGRARSPSPAEWDGQLQHARPSLEIAHFQVHATPAPAIR